MQRLLEMQYADAIADENIAPNAIPTVGELGRQSKRFKAAMELETYKGNGITEEEIGKRAQRLVMMGIESVVNEPMDFNGMVAAMGMAIQVACRPGGAIVGAIENACLPGGVIVGAIENACLPGGAIANACLPGGVIRNAITEEIRDAHEIAMAIQDAKYQNSKVNSAEGITVPIPKLGFEPVVGFSVTLRDFWRLNNRAQLVGLLEYYGLNVNGQVAVLRERLADYCRIKYLVNMN